MNANKTLKDPNPVQEGTHLAWPVQRQGERPGCSEYPEGTRDIGVCRQSTVPLASRLHRAEVVLMAHGGRIVASHREGSEK